MIEQGVPPLHVHFIHCGQGHMTLAVMPDDSVLLIDCRVSLDDESEILDHLERYIPTREDGDTGAQSKWIDWFCASHRDEDHLLGLRAVNERFQVRGIVDSGAQSGTATGAAYKYYMGLRRRIRDRFGEDTDIEPLASMSPLFKFGQAKVYCLCSGVGEDDDEDDHYGNLVIQIEFAGTRILLPGDSDWRAWKEKIVPQFGSVGQLKSTILQASHHGSRSFFLEVEPDDEEEDWNDAYFRNLRLINPSMTIISCGEQKIHNHPNPTALRHYKSHSSHEQVYLTRSKGTMVCCVYSDGNWTVIPSRFLSRWNYRNDIPSGKGFRIKCEESDSEGNFIREIETGASVKRGHNLRFIAQPAGGLTGSSPVYRFEVSNGGEGADQDHDEIFWKEKKLGTGNTFEREVAYLGIHLLRCRVSDSKTRLSAQKIFRVRGV